MTQTALIELEIKAMESLILKKRKELKRLSGKYSTRSLSQMFPSESAAQSFTIDNRQDE